MVMFTSCKFRGYTGFRIVGRLVHDWSPLFNETVPITSERFAFRVIIGLSAESSNIEMHTNLRDIHHIRYLIKKTTKELLDWLACLYESWISNIVSTPFLNRKFCRQVASRSWITSGAMPITDFAGGLLQARGFFHYRIVILHVIFQLTRMYWQLLY